MVCEMRQHLVDGLQRRGGTPTPFERLHPVGGCVACRSPPRSPVTASRFFTRSVSGEACVVEPVSPAERAGEGAAAEGCRCRPRSSRRRPSHRTPCRAPCRRARVPRRPGHLAGGQSRRGVRVHPGPALFRTKTYRSRTLRRSGRLLLPERMPITAHMPVPTSTSEGPTRAPAGRRLRR